MEKQELKATLPKVCNKCQSPIKVGDKYFRYEGHQEYFNFETFEEVKGEFEVVICCVNCEDWNIIKDVPF